MIESMTGFGSVDTELDNIKITIEIRSVNHRFFECKLRTPSFISKLDPVLRKIIKEKLLRGNIECTIRVKSVEEEAENQNKLISANYNLLSQYLKIFNEMKEKFNISGQISISDVIRIPNMFILPDDELPVELLEKNLLPAVEKCSDMVRKMQEREGRTLKKAIERYLDEIETNISTIFDKSSDLFNVQYQKITDRMNKLLTNVEISEDRILTEAGILADRLDISEELDRLKSHIQQFRRYLKNSTEPIGRKLDFIAQEINREINTIASKTEDKEITHLAVEIKTLIEKIREQVQNVK